MTVPNQQPRIINNFKRDISPSAVSNYTAKAYKTFDNQDKNLNNSITDRVSIASKKTS